ncbi:hypothetical protein B0H34DRAFT_438161 [Crassisporium funariophilum]|nr:hypothetical protein B0H34DRAFT_438161 [Crassisporium funariophilum]
MAPNEHLLKNFKVCQETYALALQLLRDANAKSIPGAGTPGAPAVCMIIAVERLNTGEYTKKSAQPPSSLSPKEFNKLYERIKGAAEKITTTPSSTTYQQLHDKYKTGLATTGVQELLSETENELLALETGCDPMSHLFKCVVFFWVINAAKVSTYRNLSKSKLTLK